MIKQLKAVLPKIRALIDEKTKNSVASKDEAIEEIIAAINELETPPRWEIAEQYERRTGKALPDNATVYSLHRIGCGTLQWFCQSYANAKQGNPLLTVVMMKEVIMTKDEFNKEFQLGMVRYCRNCKKLLRDDLNSGGICKERLSRSISDIEAVISYEDWNDN